MSDVTGVSFKLLDQRLKLGDDIIDDETIWVSLNESSGIIKVAKPIDREKYCNEDRNRQCVVHLKVS